MSFETFSCRWSKSVRKACLRSSLMLLCLFGMARTHTVLIFGFDCEALGKSLFTKSSDWLWVHGLQEQRSGTSFCFTSVFASMSARQCGDATPMPLAHHGFSLLIRFIFDIKCWEKAPMTKRNVRRTGVRSRTDVGSCSGMTLQVE